MTDRIDLDELDVPEGDEEGTPNRGDWFWGEDGEIDGDPDGDSDPPDAPEPATDTAATETTAADTSEPTATEPTTAESATSEQTPTDAQTATPRVPYANDDRPVGIPMESGGAGGVSADRREEPTQQQPEASGPHGGGADDMTMAFSYRAIRRLEDLHVALADAETWTDWLGVVGDVDAHVINKFQRDERLDLDFFNGTGTAPGERLAEVDEHSMFYAERMVLVGLEGAGERAWAEEAGWEFVPLAEAAEGAGWSLSEE